MGIHKYKDKLSKVEDLGGQRRQSAGRGKFQEKRSSSLRRDADNNFRKRIIAVTCGWVCVCDSPGKIIGRNVVRPSRNFASVSIFVTFRVRPPLIDRVGRNAGGGGGGDRSRLSGKFV